MYDAIIVGARCGGSPTAMLLARRGYKVLLLDKMSFPSDIMSTHYIHLPGVARLQRWGLLDELREAGTPLITQVRMHFGEMAFEPPRLPDLPEGVEGTYCPRRTLLDKLLVDAAVTAGAELREQCSVQELVFDDGAVAGIRARSGRAFVEERARVVIGADGMHSTVAKAVRAPEYRSVPSLSFGYYAYWSDFPAEGAELYFLEDAGMLIFPTNDGMTCIAAGGPVEAFHEFREDIEGNYLKIVTQVPAVAERIRDARRETRFRGTADQPNFFRKPYGPGWALVGDAGYHRDFVTGLGITDAFRDAELLSWALSEALSGRRPYEEALAQYERARNEIAEPLYDLTTTLLSGEPPQPAQWIAFGVAMQRMIPPLVPV